ncbi:hypothetical protein SLS63_003776 [Diaporthe eres]|uniref:Uncharacterized protein n=1 Tax=Diaporthe eres TaxID=83184 RepID=A0ABR1PFX1_DIAER
MSIFGPKHRLVNVDGEYERIQLGYHRQITISSKLRSLVESLPNHVSREISSCGYEELGETTITGAEGTLPEDGVEYLFFFGMLLGLIVKPLPLIGCGLAVWKTPPEDDIAGFRRPMNPSQQFCWGSRTAIYISELPHYLHVPEMVLHHLLTLLGMSMVAKFNISRRGLDLSLAALWSEIVYSLRNVLKWTGHLDKRPKLDWSLTFYGTLFLFVTRAPTTIAALAMIPANGLQGGPALVITMAYVFHLVYIIRITYIRLKKSGVLQVEESGVFRVQVGDRLNINSTALLTGLACMSTQVSLVLLYSWTGTGLQPIRTPELTNLMWHSVLAGLVGRSSVASVALKTFLVQMVVEAAANSAMTKTTTGISLGSLAALMTAWRSSLIEISTPAYGYERYDNQTTDSLRFSHGPSSVPHWVKLLLQDTLIVGGLYVLFNTGIDYLCNFPWNKARIPGLPRLRTIGLLTASGWVGYIVYLVSTGQTPEIQNKNFTAAEILAREPPMCSLLLSWNFWAALSATAVVPTAIVHMFQPKGFGGEETQGEVVVGSKAKEA